LSEDYYEHLISGYKEEVNGMPEENITMDNCINTSSLLNSLENYYNSHDENSRLESRHGQVEFLTTMRYIERYLTPGAKVIEIGAGTGRYSRAIADMGYPVEAVELFSATLTSSKQTFGRNRK
jgi:2-polyprenyl-3-methyl-5-hydroxy-6-metoxy-1,4-benzoquinol methylase